MGLLACLQILVIAAGLITRVTLLIQPVPLRLLAYDRVILSLIYWLLKGVFARILLWVKVRVPLQPVCISLVDALFKEWTTGGRYNFILSARFTLIRTDFRFLAFIKFVYVDDRHRVANRRLLTVEKPLRTMIPSVISSWSTSVSSTLWETLE